MLGHSLHAENLRLQYDQLTIVENINIKFDKPEIISIIGPNGSGKSTILKALCRLLQPTAGAVILNGEDMRAISTEQIAKIISVLPQSATAPTDLSIYDLVAYGRIPHRSFLQSLSAQDKETIRIALAATGLAAMSTRRLDKLSGGERQRAWLAMALAQEPKILLLDEPTTYLDVHHQLELMELVVNLHKERRITVIMVLHDLNHAARYSQRLLAVKQGRIVADGTVDKVFTTAILEDLYEVKALVKTFEHQGQCYPLCFPYSTLKKIRRELL